MSAETRLRRLYMRSIRRGIKEMDLILTAHAATHLRRKTDAELDLYEALLAENDQEIFAWVLGTERPPERYTALIAQLRDGAEGLTAPRA